MIMTSRRPEYRRIVRTAKKTLRKKPHLLAAALLRVREQYELAKQGKESLLDKR